MSTLDRLWLFRMQGGRKAGRHVVVVLVSKLSSVRNPDGSDLASLASCC